MKQVGTAFFLALAVVWGTAGAAETYVVEKAVKSVELRGYTRSKTVRVLSSEVPGRLVRIHYDIGQTVGAKPFFQIDATFVDFEIESTRHAIRQLGIALDRSASRAAFLKKEFGRIDALFQERSTPESRRDAAAEDFEQARLETESIAVEKVIQETRLRELLERKRRHTIYAPKGWVVTARHVENGEVVSIGTPLAAVSDFTRMVVPLSVSDRELEAVNRLPEAFPATLDGRPIRATIEWINPEFDEQTRKLAVEIAVTRFEGAPRGGRLFALPLQVETSGLQIPKPAVINRYDNPRVRLADGGEEIQVLVLGESDGYVVVSEQPRLAPGTVLEGIGPRND